MSVAEKTPIDGADEADGLSDGAADGNEEPDGKLVPVTGGLVGDGMILVQLKSKIGSIVTSTMGTGDAGAFAEEPPSRGISLDFKDGEREPDGDPDGVLEGAAEPDGLPEGAADGNEEPDGLPEGTTDGMEDPDGLPEGTTDGKDDPDGRTSIPLKSKLG